MADTAIDISILLYALASRLIKFDIHEYGFKTANPPLPITFQY